METKCCDTEAGKLPDPSDETLSALCKALGHPARIRLLRILLERGECIGGDLADEIDLAPSTVSEHLRILKTAGLIQGTIDGPKRCYCANTQTLKQFKNAVKLFFNIK